MKTYYQKLSYLYNKAEFFLYTPMEIEPIEETVRDGVLIKLSYLSPESSLTKIWDLYKDRMEIVKNFKSDANNMLVSDYKPRYISTFDEIKLFHEKCEVLINKRGSYTMVKCCGCGQESPLAINSFYMIDETNDQLTNCTK
jgi:hypothetical protein